jgi:glycosyltransferase involved in cell wall biosynthesis
VTQLAFCIPGDLHLPTGGYRYDREVLARLPGQGVSAVHVQLGPGFPHPTNAEIAGAFDALVQVDRRSILLIDGLALGALPPERVATLPHRIVALVHHPLGLEAGMPPARAAFLMTNEQSVLAQVRHVIVTSAETRRILMRDFAIPASRITVAEPGVERATRARGTGEPLSILSVGAISPRKAFGELVLALADCAELNWRLTIAGSLELSPPTAADLKSLIHACGLDDRITLAGAVDDAALEALFHKADLFAMSSHFEGYGMALAEARARGLPIVTTTGGAAADTVPDAAALKVAPGDRPALTAALRRVITEHGLRRRMSDASWASAALLPTWDDTARDIADAIKGL